MNAINTLFQRKQRDILSVYFTAGFPEPDDTVRVINALIHHGADLIEVGIPYSDPVADGPVIERSSAIALKNGMSLSKLFTQLKSRDKDDSVPLVLMGYINPIMQFGYENFCREAAASGVSGMIIPDLPVTEYKKHLKPYTDQYGLQFIFLVTPQTPEERIREIDELSDGFIYAVSSSSVTGRDTDAQKKEAYLSRLQSYELKTPVLVGFGIKDHQTFAQACRHTHGAIIGTAFIQAISGGADLHEATGRFLHQIRHGDQERLQDAALEQ